MRLRVKHKSDFFFISNASYGLQRLKVVAKDSMRQSVESWNIEVQGGTKEVNYVDHHGNECQLIGVNLGQKNLSVIVHGTVATKDTNSISGDHHGPSHLWMYKKQTALTKPGINIKKFCKTITKKSTNRLDFCHELAGELKEQLSYQKGITSVITTAEQALNLRTGVCQDFSHIFLSMTRHFGFSARYVSGYMQDSSQEIHAATHAWVEVFIENLGWVGFDLTNNIFIDERYISLAYGFDFSDAQPMYGLMSETDSGRNKQYLNLKHLRGNNQ